MICTNSAISHLASINQTLALVLAGGRGERLKSLTDRQAKPALHFGGKVRMIDFPLSNCVNSGFRRIAVATQYRAHELIHHVQRTWGFLRPEMSEFVELWPAQQQTPSAGWYAGTADAVYQNIELIQRHAPRYVLILSGDHVYKQDYSAMLADHINNGADVSISCIEIPREEGRRFGIVNVDENDGITKFLEKPSTPPGLPNDPNRCLASMGIYLFNTQILISALREDAKCNDSTRDFGHDIIPALLSRYHVLAHRFNRSCVGDQPYWRDVGTLDAYWQANMDLIRSPTQFNLYDENWRIWSYEENSAPARFISGKNDRCALVSDSMVGNDSVVIGASVRCSILFSHTHVAPAARVSESVILPNCEIGEGARLRRCILAEGCKIPAGLVVGEDHEQDSARFHRTAEGITVITPRMLGRLETQRPNIQKVHQEMNDRIQVIHGISGVI